MTVLYLAALAVIILSLPALMPGDWVVQQRPGNSGGVDTIWTFLVNAGAVLWRVAGAALLLAPISMYWILVYVTGIPPLQAQMLRSRGDRYRDYQLRTSPFSAAAASMKGVVI